MSDSWETSGWLAADVEDDARRREIEEMMRSGRERYFRDEAVQQEYRDIIDRQIARAEDEANPRPTRPGPFDETLARFQANRALAPDGQEDRADFESPAPAKRSLDTPDGKRIDDPRVLSDVTPDNDWMPGAQYAGRKRIPKALRGIHDDDGTKYYRPGGHHEMPGQYYRKWNLQPETAEIFKGSTTGNFGYYREEHPKGPKIGNFYNYAHRAYNEAVGELALDFFPKNGIRPDGSNMTPPQAVELLELIRLSEDPRIRDFNYNIWRMRRFRRLRSGSDD